MYEVGLDIGFGFTKVTDGVRSLVFKSVLGDVSDLQYTSSLVSFEPVEHLHVAIEGKQYFVGSLAERQSLLRHFTLQQSTLFENFAKVLAATAIGMFKNDDIQFSVVTGLPVVYYKQYKDRMIQLLKGMHRVSYFSAEGQRTERSFLVNRVQVVPQPFGTIFETIMNEQGQIVNPDLARQKVGVVDIGFRTADYTISDGLRYVERGSRTSDHGISKAFGVMAKKILERTGVSVELYRMYDSVTHGSIRILGREFNLKELREHVFQQLANSIAGDLERVWADDWDLDSVILTGGGAEELARFLEPVIAGNILTATGNGDPRLSNVLGYLKFAKWMARREGEAE